MTREQIIDGLVRQHMKPRTMKAILAREQTAFKVQSGPLRRGHYYCYWCSGTPAEMALDIFPNISHKIRMDFRNSVESIS